MGFVKNSTALIQTPLGNETVLLLDYEDKSDTQLGEFTRYWTVKKLDGRLVEVEESNLLKMSPYQERDLSIVVTELNNVLRKMLLKLDSLIERQSEVAQLLERIKEQTERSK